MTVTTKHSARSTCDLKEFVAASAMNPLRLRSIPAAPVISKRLWRTMQSTHHSSPAARSTCDLKEFVAVLEVLLVEAPVLPRSTCDLKEFVAG